MKRYLLSVAVLLASIVHAQSPFSGLSLEEACAKAKAANKIVLLVIESSNCAQCNEVAIQGLSGDIIKRLLASNAIVIKSRKVPEEITSNNQLFVLPESFFGILLMDGDKNLLQVANSSSSYYGFYAELVDKALKNKEAGEGNLAALKKAYYGGESSFQSIEQLVKQIRKLGLEPAQPILDDLTQKAPADSANSLSFLQFVLQAAPMVGSDAYKYTQKVFDNYQMAWYRMALPERILINNRVIYKSRNKAIAEKDQSYIFQVANFARTVNQSNPDNAQRAYAYEMLQYYKGIKDTQNYVRSAIAFYDQYYMSVRVDQIKTADSLEQDKVLKMMNNQPPPGVMGSGSTVTVNKISFNNKARVSAQALNEGAWYVFQFSQNPVYLSKALSFAKRANEFYESPEIMDTYARLLYMTGNKDLAIEWETKAMQKMRERVPAHQVYEKVLRQMQQGEVISKEDNQ